jgi:DNA-binding beta-propeller fold protein YncE
MSRWSRPLPTAPALVAAVATGAAAFAVSGCIGQVGRPAPTDRAVFPTGLAVSPDGTRLAVVSSNFDLAFDDGAVLLADLPALDDKLTGADAVVTEPFVSAVAVPTFGDRPVFSADGAHLLLTTRDTNLLHELTVDGDELACGRAALCAEAPHALALAQNDPFDVVLIEQGETIRGFVTHQSGREASFFILNPAEDDTGRLRLENGVVDFGEAAFGVRAVAHRPAIGGRPARLYATVERRTNNTVVGADLVSFEVPAVGRAADVTIVGIDLEQAVGSRSARDVVVLRDPSGRDVLIVALRFPDAIARLVVDDDTGLPTLTALSDTCMAPVSLAVAHIPASEAPGGSVERVLVTCQDSQAIELIDPMTLTPTDVVRFYGRGPYDVVVTPDGTRAFVSFFFDNSIGVFSLTDGTVAGLVPIGRLGTPLPRPDDGRE